MEAVFIGLGLTAVLVLISLSRSYSSGILIDSSALIASGIAWQSVHQWIMILGPNLMLGVNTVIYAYLLKKGRLVPNWLAIFGMVAAIMVFASGLLDMFGIIPAWSPIKGVISLPLGVFEVALALQLLIRGFRQEGLENLKIVQ